MKTRHPLPRRAVRFVGFAAMVITLATPCSVTAKCGCCQACRKQALVAQIQLTRAQARRLVPIFENAVKLQADHYQTMAELMPRMLETYTAFRDEDALNQGFSSEVEQATSRLHSLEVKAHDTLGSEMLKLEERVKAILSGAQLQVLAAGPQSPTMVRPETLIGQVAVGNMKALAAAVDPEIARTVRELADVAAYRHPRPTQIGRQLLDPGLAESLYPLARIGPSNSALAAIRILRQGTRECPRERYDAYKAELGRLHGEISAWNLVNGLHLNKDQAVAIAQCAYAAAGLREQFKCGVLPGPNPGPGDYSRLSDQDKVAIQMAAAPAVVEQLYRLERNIMNVLSDTQVRVILDFQPCLLPPRNLSNPVLVGQAKENTAVSGFLARTRRLPRARQAAAVGHWLEHEERHNGKYDDEYRAHRRRLLLDTVAEAAQMNETEFEMHRNELAQRAQPADVKEELQYQLGHALAARHMPGRVAKALLFDPHMPLLLETRARQLSKPLKTARRDLKTGPQADNCDRGKCALPGRKNGKSTR